MFPTPHYQTLVADLQAVEVNASRSDLFGRYALLDRLAGGHTHDFDFPAGFEVRVRDLFGTECPTISNQPLLVLWLGRDADAQEVQEVAFARPDVCRRYSTDLLQCRTALTWQTSGRAFQLPTAGFRLFRPESWDLHFVLCVASPSWVTMRALCLDDDHRLDLQVSGKRSEHNYRPHQAHGYLHLAEAVAESDAMCSPKFETTDKAVWLRRHHVALL